MSLIYILEPEYVTPQAIDLTRNILEGTRWTIGRWFSFNTLILSHEVTSPSGYPSIIFNVSGTIATLEGPKSEVLEVEKVIEKRAKLMKLPLTPTSPLDSTEKRWTDELNLMMDQLTSVKLKLHFQKFLSQIVVVFLKKFKKRYHPLKWSFLILHSTVCFKF